MVLVSGGTGFIGSYVVKKLVDKGFTVKCLVRKSSDVSSLNKLNVMIYYGDLADYESVNTAVKGEEVVIHLAAELRSTEKAVNDLSNVIGTKNIVKACEENNVSKLIFTSSANTMFKKKGLYGITKLKAEHIVKGSSVGSIIFIPSVVYGKGDVSVSNVINYAKTFPVLPMFGNGKAKTMPVYVEDFAEVIVNSVTSEINSKVYHIGGPVISFNDFFKKICSSVGIKKRIVHLPLFIFKPLVFIYGKVVSKPKVTMEQIYNMTQDQNLDVSNARKDLGFKPRNFDEGMKVSYG